MYDPFTHEVIAAAIEVHRALGPGLLESVYRVCLVHELSARGMSVATEMTVPIRYKGLDLDAGLRLDLVVEDKLILELKACETTLPVHEAQLLSYLRHSGIRFGLLINFHAIVLHRGIKRVVNGWK